MAAETPNRGNTYDDQCRDRVAATAFGMARDLVAELGLGVMKDGVFTPIAASEGWHCSLTHFMATVK